MYVLRVYINKLGNLKKRKKKRKRKVSNQCVPDFREMLPLLLKIVLQ